MNIFELTRILNETNELDIQKSKRSLKATTDWVVRKKIQELGSEPTQKKEKELSELEDNLDRAKSFIVSLDKQKSKIGAHRNDNLVKFLENKIESLRNVGITHSWIMNFLNSKNVTLDLSPGYHNWQECCEGLLSPKFVQRFFNLSKNSIGSGEFLLLLLALKTGKNASKPEKGQGGDLNIDGMNYEVKGIQGRLDVDVNNRGSSNVLNAHVIKTLKGQTDWGSSKIRNNEIINSLLGVFFNNRNKEGDLIVVNPKGYYVIKNGVPITDNRIEIIVPQWLRYAAYGREIPFNDNDRTIKISLI